MPIFVNEVEITDDEVHAEMKHHPASSLDDARHQAARALVIRQLLIQEAIRKKLLSENEHSKVEQEEAVDQLLNLEVFVPEANEESCHRYYRQNQERFLHKVSGTKLAYEHVKDQIHHYLHTRCLRIGISQYIKTLSAQACIVGYDLEASEESLVQ